MGIAIHTELIPTEVLHNLTLDLMRFYWNCCFAEVENNLFGQSKIFGPEKSNSDI